MILFRVSFEPGISLHEQVVYSAKKALISGQIRPGEMITASASALSPYMVSRAGLKLSV